MLSQLFREREEERRSFEKRIRDLQYEYSDLLHMHTNLVIENEQLSKRMAANPPKGLFECSACLLQHDYVCLPCMHTHICSTCFHKFSKCPLCRSDAVLKMIYKNEPEERLMKS